MVGTLTNTIAVVSGGFLGFAFGRRFSPKVHSSIFSALGLFTIYLGIKMSLETKSPIVMVISLVLGTIAGELVKIQKLSEKLSDSLKGVLKVKDKKFTDGLITSFMLFCTGSLTLLGTMAEGTTGDAKLLLTKSTMDFFASITLASAFGVGTIFSAIPLFLVQGGLTLFFKIAGSDLPIYLIGEMSALGGLLIVGIGLNLLKLKKLRLLNMLPSLLFQYLILRYII